jgi:hypothetical protein
MKRYKPLFEAIIKLTKENIQTLKLNDYAIMYHGTDLDTAIEFSTSGIDATKKISNRIYHSSKTHTDMNGLFVTWVFEEAKKYAKDYILEMTLPIKNLHSSSIDKEELKNISLKHSKAYQNSENPALTDSLLYDEFQALFIGILKPKYIINIFIKEGSSWKKYSVGDFLEEYNEKI